eukprot:gene18112-18351_t
MVENRQTNIAQRLRRNPTDAEKALWARLKGRQLGLAFTRQCPIGGHVVDFACRSARLAIEVDGGQHADSAPDAVRAQVIESHGYQIIRFWNNDELGNTDGVIQAILTELAIAREGLDALNAIGSAPPIRIGAISVCSRIGRFESDFRGCSSQNRKDHHLARAKLRGRPWSGALRWTGVYGDVAKVRPLGPSCRTVNLAIHRFLACDLLALHGSRCGTGPLPHPAAHE